MARIGTYVLDENITGDDFLLGNDGNGSVVTKRFKVSDLRDFYNQNTDITEYVPEGWTASITEGGEAVRRSPLQVIQVAANNNPLTFDIATVGASTINLNLGGSGGVTIDFVNYTEAFDLNTFAEGTTVTITDSMLSTPLVGTVGRLTTSGNSDFIYNNDGDYVYQLQVEGITITEGVQGIDQVAFTTTPVSYSANFGGNVNVNGDLNAAGSSTIGGNLTVTGSSQLGNRVEYWRFY